VVVAARKLHSRRHRELQRCFLIEGPGALREALAAPTTCVRTLFVSPDGLARHGELVEAARGLGVELHDVDERLLLHLSETVTPQGLIAIGEFFDVALFELPWGEVRLVAVGVDVRDPGNAGTLIRVADAAGADAVVLSGSSVDPYNGKCVRSTAGSLFHLPLVTGVSSDEVFAAAQKAGVRLLATAGGGERDLFAEAESGALRAPTLWLFGNEAHGLAPEIAERADARVSIPIFGRAESLNLATAAAVCLYTSARAQRGADSSAKGV
jgi:TrmH family RNA methyltransferase